VGEYYDIAALGYLQAVQRYLTQPELMCYRFSTIAWSAMRQSVATFHRAEARRRESERRYLDALWKPEDESSFQVDSRLFLHDLAAISSEEQYALARLRLQGYSVAEAAKAQGVSPKRVRRLLKELFHVYLQLCGREQQKE
jgi:RNA polymerase sigma-70 factor (ECF subfamily)